MARKLDVEEIADLAVTVGVVCRAVELQEAYACRLQKACLRILALGEFDAVGGGLHAVVPILRA